MTSSILPPRNALAPCSPSTHAMASTTLDLPEPLGPTTQVMPGSSRSVVAEAKDLKPLTVRLLRCTDLRGSAVRVLACRLPAGPVGDRTRRAQRGCRVTKFGQKDARRHRGGGALFGVRSRYGGGGSITGSRRSAELRSAPARSAAECRLP